MSKIDTIKTEVISGGSAAVNDPSEKADPVVTWVGLTAWVGVFVWIAFASWWIFAFAVGVLIAIFLHEVGHYVTARRSGMKVTQFFIGFGPRVWSVHRNNIEYGLRAIPLGAFVKIIGMTNMDEIPADDEARTFRSSTYPRRMWVITAGSVMHMLIAIVLITAVYATWGPVGEIGTVTIGQLVGPDEEGYPGGPAFRAGVKPGDVVRSVAGTEVTTSDQMVTAIRDQPVGSTFDLQLERDGQPLTVAVTSVAHPDDEDKPSYLGVYPTSTDRIGGQSFASSLDRGTRDLFTGVGQATVGVVKVINPTNVFGHLTGTNTDETSRPGTLVGAARLSDLFGRLDGWAGILTLLAIVNISVGLFNMFPLLPLDGGHAAIATYERLRSRRGRRYVADVTKMMPVVTATVVLLAFMFLTGLYLDIARPIR
jgi:membrane-associated protease RseP (regulator of RpoE activity)